MLKYFVIQLDNSSVSYCYYANNKSERKLIPLLKLNEAIIWALKNNLLVQVVYPTHLIPPDYQKLIDSIYHASIVPINYEDKNILHKSDVVVISSCKEIESIDFGMFIEKVFILKVSFNDLCLYQTPIYKMMPQLERLNIVIEDAENLTNENAIKYQHFLSGLSEIVYNECSNGHMVQCNLLTDRIILNGMNNCEAGTKSVTVAPDCNLYACPAFYLSDTPFSLSIGDLENGIINTDYSNLCKIENAPICRICDAWQCKRCIWMNSKSTLEINTPSREQCIISHIERAESKKLLNRLNEVSGVYLKDNIPSIDYFDPLEKLMRK